MARSARELKLEIEWEGSGEGLGEPRSLQKICENLNLKPCRQSGAQFKQQSIYLFSLLLFFLISLFSFSMRGVVVMPPKAAIHRGANYYRGVSTQFVVKPERVSNVFLTFLTKPMGGQ